MAGERRPSVGLWWRDVGYVVSCFLVVVGTAIACSELFGWELDRVATLAVSGLAALVTGMAWAHRESRRPGSRRPGGGD